MHRFLFSLALAILVTHSSATSPPNSWPQWRGDGTGVSNESNLPLSWSTEHNVLWCEKVPGYGWSNPVVAQGKVFLTTAVFEGQSPPLQKGPPGGEGPPAQSIQRIVLCLDATTGKTLWQHTVADGESPVGNHPSNTWATETPVTDGRQVYFVFGNVGVYCFDFEGKSVWEYKIEPHKVFGNWGTSSSPVLDGNRLYLVCDNNDASYLLALDTKTGQPIWRERRQERSTWSTPLIWRNKVRTELVVMGSSYIRGYDPATGQELWRLASESNMGGRGQGGGRSAGPPASASKGKGGPGSPGGKAKSGGCKASPTCTPEMLYVGMSTSKSEGELGPMWAVKAGVSGDISLLPGETSNSFIAWFRDDAGSHFTSPLVYDGCLYVFTGQAGHPLNVFDASTGKTLYQERLGSARSNMGSPFAFDGNIACIDSGGTAFVLKSGPEFKLLATNDLGAMTWSSPALADGRLFIRTASQLYCIGSK